MELQRLPFWSVSLFTAGTTVYHTHAQPFSSLVMMRSSDVRDFCKAVVSNERRRSSIGSQVETLFQTIGVRLPHLAIRLGSTLDYRPSRSSAFREASIPFRMDTYLLPRNCSIEATRSASIWSEADHSL